MIISDEFMSVVERWQVIHECATGPGFILGSVCRFAPIEGLRCVNFSYPKLGRFNGKLLL